MSARSAVLRSALALCLIALGLFSSGCGGSDGADTASTPAQGEATSTAAEGGEKSIENFGEEASGDDEASILGVFSDYLNALAEEDDATACANLASNVQQSLKQLASRGGKDLGCEQILPALLSPSAPAVAKQQANGEIKKVRVEGDRAFVVFHAPGAKLYMMGLVSEGGEWKATTVIPSVLVPDL